MKSSFKPITIRPLTSVLDCRSSPDEMIPGSFRMKLNMEVTEDRRLCRRPGHRRLLHDNGNINWDWHDQGYCNSTNPDREAAYLLRETTDTLGTRRLLIGKRDQIAALATNAGTWTPLFQTGIYGGDATSTAYWKIATLGNFAVFNNNFDPPLYYRLGAQPSFCGETLVNEIPELKNTVKLTRAGVVETFNGTVFLMNTIENGSAFPSRVRWSALNSVTKWTSTLSAGGVASNISGFQDLPYGERILACKELQGNLYIFTETSIWRCYVAGGEGIYGFVIVYTDQRNRNRCLKYPRTVVADGGNIYYFSTDGIYRYNPYEAVPVRDEWIHLGTGILFEELDPSCCDGPVGESWPDRSEIYWSYTRSGEICANSRTFIANTESRTTDYLDHGFSAFTNFRPDERQTLADWIAEFCTDDFASMCNTLGNRVIDDFCNECNSQQLFLGVSGDDLCVKELGVNYSRERCTNAATGHGALGPTGDYVPFTATYALDGYFSIMRGVLPLGAMDEEKVVRRLLIENSAAFQLDAPAQVRLRLGTAYKALDPNPQGNPFAFAYSFDNDLAPAVAPFFTVDGSACEVLWDDQEDLALSCPDEMTAQEHRANFTRPAGPAMEWALYEQGRFLFWEAVVVGKDSNGAVVPPTGGQSCYSRIEIEARLV